MHNFDRSLKKKKQINKTKIINNQSVGLVNSGRVINYFFVVILLHSIFFFIVHVAIIIITRVKIPNDVVVK